MSLSPTFPITISLDIIETTACNFGNSIYLSQYEYDTITEQINLSMSFDEVWNIIDSYVYNKTKTHPVPIGNIKLWGRNVGQQRMKIDNDIDRNTKPCISIDIDNFNDYRNQHMLVDNYGKMYMELAVIVDSNQNNEEDFGINLEQQSATKRQKLSDCSYGGSKINKYQSGIQSDIDALQKMTRNELKSQLNQLGLPSDGTRDQLKTRLFRELIMPDEEEIECNSDEDR